MDIALDRLGVLLDQPDSARVLGQPTLEDLADDEYLWGPARVSWSVHRRGENVGAQAYGPGDWQLDFEPDPPEPPPVTAIAWWTNQEVIHHLAEIALLRDLWRAGIDREQTDSARLPEGHPRRPVPLGKSVNPRTCNLHRLVRGRADWLTSQ